MSTTGPPLRCTSILSPSEARGSSMRSIDLFPEGATTATSTGIEADFMAAALYRQAMRVEYSVCGSSRVTSYLNTKVSAGWEGV